MSFKRNVSLFFLFLLFTLCSAQNDVNWYFGNGAGLSFVSGSPVAVSGSTSAFEACSAVSDSAGNLLFYTDGTTVYDGTHTVMPNGNGIGGGSSATSTIIAPYPGRTDLYIIFSVEDHLAGINRLRYSVVNMCLNGGLGDVVVGQKGVLLGPSYAEKMVAIESGVAGEYWLVAHVLGGTDYHSFRVTGAGVNSTPVISSGSAFHGSTCMIGYMKSNHAGTKIITAQTFCNDVEMVDFDKSTGTVSNPVSVNAEAQIYGIEFSPDDQLFYLARNYTICEIYQFNTSTPTTAGLMIDTKPGTYAYGALQLAPDGRIYVARAGQGALDLISNPNVAGVGCGYVTDGFALAGGTLCQNGLPHFPQFRFGNPPPAGSVLEPSYFLDCQGLNFMGWVDDSTSGLTYTWSTSDTLTGGTSPSAGPSVSWVFSTSGPHTVTVIQSGCNPDTVTFVAEPQDTMPDLGGPYSVCFGDSVALTAFLPGAYYLWSTGESTASISVSQTGNYWVSVTSPCSTFVDSAKVEVLAGGGEATMANVFTPNADGINDQFCVGPEVNSADEFYLGVWDRWGRLLFETAQPGDCWSGKFNGKEEVDGVYFWVMRFKDCKGELNTVTGNVTLLR